MIINTHGTRRSLDPVRAGILACFLTCFLLVAPSGAQAQGDGPHVMLPGPVGIQPLSLTWMSLDSNFNFNGSIQIPDGGLDGGLWALNYNRYFDLGGRMAEIWVTGIGGDLDGFLVLPDGERVDSSSSGVSDPYVAMRVGLVGAPALDPAKFAQHTHGFSMYGLVGLTLPWGDYSQRDALNLGTNRWSLRLGLPMAIPFGDRGATWLELHPSVYIFGDNDEPFRADQREQDPLFVTEAHLSQFLTPRLWASLDLRYQYGGETTTDGVKDDNRNNQWGGGASVGYNFTQKWQGFVGYGKIFAGSDDSNGDMWRARLIYVF